MHPENGNGSVSRWRDWALRALLVGVVAAAFTLAGLAYLKAEAAERKAVCTEVMLIKIDRDIQELKTDVRQLLAR